MIEVSSSNHLPSLASPFKAFSTGSSPDGYMRSKACQEERCTPIFLTEHICVYLSLSSFPQYKSFSSLCDPVRQYIHRFQTVHFLFTCPPLTRKTKHVPYPGGGTFLPLKRRQMVFYSAGAWRQGDTRTATNTPRTQGPLGWGLPQGTVKGSRRIKPPALTDLRGTEWQSCGSSHKNALGFRGKVWQTPTDQ